MTLASMSVASNSSPTVAVVYGSPAGLGGLGIQSANAIADLKKTGARVLAFGPGPVPSNTKAHGVDWRLAAPERQGWKARYTWLRWWTGRRQFINDVRLGRWAADAVASAKPDCCYCFTQVALETFRWANRVGVPAILESPNGHIQNFRDVYCRETRRWGRGAYLGHPNQTMVERVEEEYARADLIRVSSDWARQNLIAFGVAERKLTVVPQRPTAPGFRPPQHRPAPEGRFRVCFVGSLDLRKGFVYLLRAARRFGPERISLQLVGGTTNRMTRRLLARERIGLDVEVTPGDALPALQRNELFVLPTLEDGSPFAVVEAMAAGTPLVVTDQCGNAPLIRPEETGWVISAGDEEALLGALEKAYARRADLPRMGATVRADWERLAAESNGAAMEELLRVAAENKSRNCNSSKAVLL